MNEQIQIIMFGVNLLIAVGAGWGTAFLVIGKYKEKVDSLEKEKNKIQDKVDELRSDSDKFSEFKINAQKFIDSKIYASSSPLVLTEYGQQLINQSGFADIFPKVKDDLVTKLEEVVQQKLKDPSKKYDIQEMARALMDELTNYKSFEAIKIYAFQNGKDYQQILRAGAILLRDYYLEKHPEITQ